MTRRKEQPSIEDLGRPDVKPIEGKTETQRRYINAIKNFKLIFATGSAGTGKTWLATALAAQALLNDRTEGIILTRPAVEAGESLGFLPGEIEEKFEPYLQPFKQVLYERLGKGKAEYMIKAGKIKAIPLAYLRGHAEPLNSMIPTPNGYVRMGDLKVGDMVFGSNGEPTKITGIYPQGKIPVADVTFADGEIVRCSKTHLWATRNQTARTRNKPFTVKTTEEIQKTLASPKGVKKHEIPIVSKPIEFESKVVPIHPYFLGLLLGDGGLTGNQIRFTTKDIEIVNWIREHLKDSENEIHLANDQSSIDYYINRPQDKKTSRANPLITALKELKLFGEKSYEKFIPDEYLYNSSEVRLELLRGLMDTDGSVFFHKTSEKKNTRVQYYTSSVFLAQQVSWLVKSLGGIVRMRLRAVSPEAHCVRNRIFHSRFEMNVLDIILPSSINPFRLKRKAEMYKPSNLFRIITNVEDVGEEECQCIEVEAKDHLYLTGNFVVTHNTFKNCFVILDEAQNTSPTQMKMFLTRIGENCTVVVNGDTSQQDIRGESGLTDAIERLSYIPSVKIIEFKKEDIVRSGLVQEIVEAYEKPKEDKRPLKEYKRFYERKDAPVSPYTPATPPNPYDPPLGGWTCETTAKEVIAEEVKTAEDRLTDEKSPFSRFFQNHIKNLSL